MVTLKPQTIKLTLFQGGYCTHQEKMVLRTGRKETIRFPSMFALIEHPEHGFILFDTGYSSRFYEATTRFPASLYARLTPVFLQPEQTAVRQLALRGIAPEEISHVIISHFHGDHVAGLRDFPKAELIAMANGYHKVKNLRGFAAVKQGFLPELLPADFQQRARLISSEGFVKGTLPPFEGGLDLFEDGSILLVPLEGHYCGQIGAWVNEQTGPVFLVADACWLRRAFEQYILPHPLAMFIMNNAAQYRLDLQHLHQYHREHPEVRIIPSHCQQSFELI